MFVSAAFAWEISTKARLGKLPGAVDVAADIAGCVASQSFTGLDVTMGDPEAARRAQAMRIRLTAERSAHECPQE